MGLFGPAWKSKNEAKAIAAVQKITDENELRTVVLNGRGNAAIEALRRIQSQEFLQEAAQDAPDPKVRLACAERLTDSNALRKLVRTERDQNVRKSLSDLLWKKEFESADRLMQSGNLFAAAKAFWEIQWGDAAKKKFEECIDSISLEAKAQIDRGQYKEAHARLAAVYQTFKLTITPVHPKWKGEKIQYDNNFFCYCYGLASTYLQDFKGYQVGFCVYQKEEYRIALLQKAYEAGVRLMEHGDYQNAIEWFEDLQHYCSHHAYKDVLPAEDIDRKYDECRTKWRNDPANPDYCPASEDHWHSYELIDSDYPPDKTVGWEKKRCKNCGKTVTEEVGLFW